MVMMRLGVILLLCGVSVVGRAEEPNITRPEIPVVATDDFEFTDTRHKAWDTAKWVPLQRRSPADHDYTARFKTLYSSTGIYFLFDGTDQRLTATLENDFDNLWTEDVYEVFLWTNEDHPIYLEYEISPLGKELPILVPNFDDKFFGWRPWKYEGERRIRKRVTVQGLAESGAAIKGWSAEVFIPWDLLRPLTNVPAKPGMKWRANVYRIDYDGDGTTQWNWTTVGPSFHEYQKYGTLSFK